MATLTGRATWYDCCANDGESCNGNCTCNCSDGNSGTNCCTACCEACNSNDTSAAAYASLTSSCSGYPNLGCNSGVSVHYCGGSYPVTLFDQLSPCNSGPTAGCDSNGTQNTVLDLVDGTFVSIGANLDDGAVYVTMTY